MAQDVYHAGNSDEQVHDTSMRTECPTTTIGMNSSSLLSSQKVKSTDEAARSEDMRSLIEESIRDVFTIEYYTATDAIANSSFSLVENVCTDLLHRCALKGGAELKHRALVKLGHFYGSADR